jgi:DHA1 family tetracycline resistance protein-like MFS transporter
MRPSAREAFILITLLLDSMGFGLVSPVLPRLVEELTGAGPSEAGSVFGLLNSAYAGALFLCSPVLGRLSDRFGRRPVILLSLAGAVVNYTLAATAHALWLLFMARLVGGICGANAAPAAAYVADVTPAERRTAVFGQMGAVFGLGLAVGPALGGLLGDLDPRLPFLAAAGLAAASLLYGCLVLPESLVPARRRPFALSAINPFASLLSRRRSPVIRGMLAGFFLYILGQTATQATWVLFMEQHLGWNPADIGISMAVLGIVWVTAQAGLTPLIVRRLGERSSLILGLAVTTGVYLLYGFVERGWQVYAVMAISAFAFVAGPAAQGIISRAAADGEQGELQGAVAGVTSLASIFGPTLGGWSFGYFTGAAAPLPLPGAAFFLGASCSLLALVSVAYALAVRAPAAGIPVPGHPGTPNPAMLIDQPLAREVEHVVR